MSVLGYGRSVLAVMAVGVVGGGCGPEATREELPSKSWQRAYSAGWATKVIVPGSTTINSDELLDVVVEPSGTVLVAGYENGVTGAANIDPSGNSRGVIFRFTPWLAQEGGALVFGSSNGVPDVIEALALRPGSNDVVSTDVYFVGRTVGSYNTPNKGQFDTIAGWVSGWNSSSNGQRYVFQYGNERPQHPRRLSLDVNGDLIISGYNDTYVPSNYVEAWEDPFVMKVRREGNALKSVPEWEVSFNTAYADLLPGMCVDGQGNVYVSGVNEGGTKRGMFVKQFLANGSAGWHSQQTGISVDMAAATAMTQDGKLLYAGSTFAQLGGTLYGEQDVVVRKLDPNNGQTLWTKQYGSAATDWVTDMTVDAMGNIYVVGETFGSMDPLVMNQGENDIFVLKLAPDGSLLNVFQMGSEGDDHPSAIAVDSTGDIYVVGYTTGSLAEEGGNVGGRDGFLMKLSPPGLVGI